MLPESPPHFLYALAKWISEKTTNLQIMKQQQQQTVNLLRYI